MKKSERKLLQEELECLFDDLLLLNMKELKNICERFGFSAVRKKERIIEQLKRFVLCGEVLSQSALPAQSVAKKGDLVILKSDSLILYGAYKNDLRTRIFMKELVGDHFHFTAYGIDWIEERWQNGNPPTYSEFARFWQQERERRLKSPVAPKEEWAYINFLQSYRKRYSTVTKADMLKAWHIRRKEAVEHVRAKLFPLDSN